MAIHFSTLAWRIPWTEETVHEVAKSLTRLSNLHFHYHIIFENKNIYNLVINKTQELLGRGMVTHSSILV